MSIEKQYTKFMFIAYPEDCYPDWKERISSHSELSGFFILHDLDRRPDGTYKKSHFHFYLEIEKKKTVLGFRKLIREIIAPTINFVYDCGNTLSVYEYFSHKNNPEKYQYPSSLIRPLNSYSISKIEYNSEKKASDKQAQEVLYTRSLIKSIISNEIGSMQELVSWTMCQNDDGLLHFLMRKFAFFNTYILSQRQNYYSYLDRQRGNNFSEYFEEKNKSE